VASLDSTKPLFAVAPEYHVFIGGKAPWFEITDDLPRYAEYPPQV
jgi:hypothetical protein